MIHEIAWFLLIFYFHGASLTPMATEKACQEMVKKLADRHITLTECIKVDS